MREPTLAGGLRSLLFTDGAAEAQMTQDQEKVCLTPRDLTELMRGQDGQSRLRKWPRQRQRGWRELGFSGKGATLPAGSLESPVTLTRDPTVPHPVDMSRPHLSDVPLGRSLLYLPSRLSFLGNATLSSISRTSKCWAASQVRPPTPPPLPGRPLPFHGF